MIFVGSITSLSLRKIRQQFVTKTSQLQPVSGLFRTGKAGQAKKFNFLTSRLARWGLRFEPARAYDFSPWHGALDSIEFA